jgi:hypothetical protein
MVSVYYRDASKVMRKIKGISYGYTRGSELLQIDKSVYTSSRRFADSEIDYVFERVK